MATNIMDVMVNKMEDKKILYGCPRCLLRFESLKEYHKHIPICKEDISD